MQLSYDPTHNIAYLRLQERTPQVETIRTRSTSTLAPDGIVYGIGLLNANGQLCTASSSSSTRPSATVTRCPWAVDADDAACRHGP